MSERSELLSHVGTLALVGGGEFSPGCDFDRELLAAADADTVLVMPTGAAFEHPGRTVDAATAWFGGLGAKAEGLMVLSRPDAFAPEYVARLRESRFTYLTGSSPMHLRSVLKDTPAWDALGAALAAGGVLAASWAGAMVLSDPMVDPRGGAFTVGLGLVPARGRRPARRGLVGGPPAPDARPGRERSAAHRAVPRGRQRSDPWSGWAVAGVREGDRLPRASPGGAGGAARQLSVIVTDVM